jgi:hypothetical protein
MQQEPNSRSSVDPQLAGETIAAISSLQATLKDVKAEVEALVRDSQRKGAYDAVTGEPREEPNDG